MQGFYSGVCVVVCLGVELRCHDGVVYFFMCLIGLWGSNSCKMNSDSGSDSEFVCP